MSKQKAKPNFEEVISDFLDGDMKKNALDFIVYLRENKMSITRASGGAWKITYKGKGLGRILWLDKGSWTLCPYADYTKDFDDFITNKKLQKIIWNNLFSCHRCHPHSCAPKGKEETFIGHKKVYFGKEVDNMCKHWDAVFRNPDEETINCVKRMIDFRKQNIINNIV